MENNQKIKMETNKQEINYFQALNPHAHAFHSHPVHQEIVKKERLMLIDALTEVLKRRTETGVVATYTTVITDAITAATFKDANPDFARYWFVKGLRIGLQSEFGCPELITLETLLPVAMAFAGDREWMVKEMNRLLRPWAEDFCKEYEKRNPLIFEAIEKIRKHRHPKRTAYMINIIKSDRTMQLFPEIFEKNAPNVEMKYTYGCFGSENSFKACIYLLKHDYDNFSSLPDGVINTFHAELWKDDRLESFPEDYHPDGVYDEKQGVAVRREKLLAKVAGTPSKKAKTK